VAQQLHPHLVEARCSAAVIPNVLDTPQGSRPPQLTFVTPATKLVTIAVRGNDIDYNALAVGCAGPATCPAPPTPRSLGNQKSADSRHDGQRWGVGRYIQTVRLNGHPILTSYAEDPAQSPTGINQVTMCL
jgi:hypothetical protein